MQFVFVIKVVQPIVFTNEITGLATFSNINMYL